MAGGCTGRQRGSVTLLHVEDPLHDGFERGVEGVLLDRRHLAQVEEHETLLGSRLLARLSCNCFPCTPPELDKINTLAAAAGRTASREDAATLPSVLCVGWNARRVPTMGGLSFLISVIQARAVSSDWALVVS